MGEDSVVLAIGILFPRTRGHAGCSRTAAVCNDCPARILGTPEADHLAGEARRGDR